MANLFVWVVFYFKHFVATAQSVALMGALLLGALGRLGAGSVATPSTPFARGRTPPDDRTAKLFSICLP